MALVGQTTETCPVCGAVIVFDIIADAPQSDPEQPGQVFVPIRAECDHVCPDGDGGLPVALLKVA